MADEEIRRRRTNDPEMDAITIISQALRGLDRDACRRVLQWAQKRYVDPPSDRVIENVDGAKAIGNFMEAIGQLGNRLQIMPPARLIPIMERIVNEAHEQEKAERALQEANHAGT